MNSLIVARRKGGMVRYFNTRTAKMGGWVPDPDRARRYRSSISGMNRDAWITGYVEESMKRTVAFLRLKANHYSVPFTTKTRKAQLAQLLAERSWDEAIR